MNHPKTPRARRSGGNDIAVASNGIGAATTATKPALRRAGTAEQLILVEGVSDQVAVETLAGRREIDLDLFGVVVIPMGGAQAIGRMLSDYGRAGRDLRIVGLCDAGEECHTQQALVAAGLGPIRDRAAMATAGFHVCDRDLEDELIRAVDAEAIEDLFGRHGDLAAFRTLQKQGAWRDRPVADQMRRFLGAGARRKWRYARIMVEALDLDRVPAPLDAVLNDAVGIMTGSADGAPEISGSGTWPCRGGRTSS